VTHGETLPKKREKTREEQNLKHNNTSPL
jgi:hypothetical protein